MAIEIGPKALRADARAENDRLRTRVKALEAVLGYREQELLDLKGPCSTAECRLHYAHSGPCDFPAPVSVAAPDEEEQS